MQSKANGNLERGADQQAQVSSVLSKGGGYSSAVRQGHGASRRDAGLLGRKGGQSELWGSSC
jgi:hypothetical protein